MSFKRVVVTGLGLVSPLGNNVEDSWSALISSKTGVSSISRFDASSLPSRVAGEVKNFNPEQTIDPREIRKMDLFIQYGYAAAAESITDSAWLPDDEYSKSRTGVLIGSGIGGISSIEDSAIKFSNGQKVSPFFIPSCLINLTSGHVSIKYGFTGPNHSVVTACATGAHAIGDAFRLIKYGYADVMVAGGSEAPICMTGVGGFAAIRALSTGYNDEPAKSSRPWDKSRDGFVIAEGAGVVVLEEYDHALKRGANIYAEIVGYGMAGDGYNIVAPHPDGKGCTAAIIAALKEADLDVSLIDYINAHATSTPVGDILELRAVQKLFTNNNLLMSSTKGATGHMLGAAGSAEFIFTVLAMKNSIVPPTINLENPEDEAIINLVPNNKKDHEIRYAISNSFGFGGTNASLVIKSV